MSARRIALVCALAGTLALFAAPVYPSAAAVLGFAVIPLLIAAAMRGRFERERQSRDIVEASPLGIFVHVRGKFEYVNPTAMREFGASSVTDLIGKPIENVVHPGAKHDFYRRLDGQRFPVEAYAAPVVHKGSAGEVVFFRNATQLDDRERWFQVLADTIPAIVCVTSPEGEVRYLNSRWREFTGINERSPEPERVRQTLHPDELPRIAERWKQAIAAGTPFEQTFRFRREDGTYRWHVARALPMRGSAGEIVKWFGVALDIDDSMRMKARTEQAVENERARIARDLHDDLGQLLAVTKMSIESASATVDLSRAAEAVSAAMVRTRDIAVLLRPPAIDRFGLSEALRWQAREFQRTTGIRCDVYTPDDVERKIPQDRRLAVYRIVQEALNNVSRHSAATEVAIEADYDESGLSITVRDNGIGMDPTAERRPSSLGILGMQERALLANGVVEIESGPGKGTAVRLRLRYDSAACLPSELCK